MPQFVSSQQPAHRCKCILGSYTYILHTTQIHYTTLLHRRTTITPHCPISCHHPNHTLQNPVIPAPPLNIRPSTFKLHRTNTHHPPNPSPSRKSTADQRERIATGVLTTSGVPLLIYPSLQSSNPLSSPRKPGSQSDVSPLRAPGPGIVALTVLRVEFPFFVGCR